MNLRSILQMFAHGTGAAFRMLPKARRFRVAHCIAMNLAPLLRRTRWFARRPSLIDGPREEALRIVQRTMTRARVEFVPDVEVVGRELVEGRAVLIVSGHFLLNITMTRLLVDTGRRVTVGLGGPREPLYYLGTRDPLDIRYAGPRMFVQIRDEIARGNTAFLTVEVEKPTRPHETWVTLDTVVGRRYVSPAAFRFAERAALPLVFGATYFNPDGRLTITYQQPHAKDAEGMLQEFCEFLRGHVAAVRR